MLGFVVGLSLRAAAPLNRLSRLRTEGGDALLTEAGGFLLLE